MAKKNTDVISYNVELRLTPEQSQAVLEKVEGEASDGQKIGNLALTCLAEIAAGGLLIFAIEKQHMVEASGIEFTTGEDLVPYLSDVAGMEEGFHVVKVRIDPEYYAACEEIAEIRGEDVDTMVQRAVENAQMEGWFESIPENRLSFLTMNPTDKENLEKTLGEKFNSGTELLKLVRTALGMDAGSELFGDVIPEQEVTA